MRYRVLTFRTPSLEALRDHLVSAGYAVRDGDGSFRGVAPGLEISPSMGRRVLTPAVYDDDGEEVTSADLDTHEIRLVKLSHDMYERDTDAEVQRDTSDEAPSRLATAMRGVTSDDGYIKPSARAAVELVPDAASPKAGPFGGFQ